MTQAISTPTVSTMLADGLALHRAGNLAEAERTYRAILAVQPNHPDSLHLLGMIAHQRGEEDVAADLIRSAIAAGGKEGFFHCNLGVVLQFQRKLDEAASSYRQAIALKPDLTEAHSNLGVILHAQRKFDEAVECYRRALALKPGCAEVYCNLGNTLQAQGKLGEAVACQARALALKPDYAEALGNLGNALCAQGKLDEAVACHERALALRPNWAEACYNLGSALQVQGKLEEALANYDRALALKPDYADAHYNTGSVAALLGNTGEALARYRKVLALRPGDPRACFSEALTVLFAGDFASGWGLYESRWNTTDHQTPMRSYAQPLWRGEKLTSGRVLVWREQGVGDEIMFAGLIPDLVRTGNRCVVECDSRLAPLFARSFPDAKMVSGEFDVNDSSLDIAAHVPCGSLPGLFRTSDAAFAAAKSPYLVPDAAKRESFRARYADGRRLIGLAWHTTSAKRGRSRSIDLAQFTPLFSRGDIQWISLQYGNHDELESQIAKAGTPIRIDRRVDQFADLDLFAGQVATMDLVITIDNSTAHLAGALGVPVWVMLPFAPDWRWLEKREDSPWYPTMRLFRQPKSGDWPSVIERVGRALASGAQNV